MFRHDGGRRPPPASRMDLPLRQDSTTLALLAFDHEGNLFIAETGGSLIRRLSPDGQVSTVAGPAGGLEGNPVSRDGKGEYALFSSPRPGSLLTTLISIAVDATSSSPKTAMRSARSTATASSPPFSKHPTSWRGERSHPSRGGSPLAPRRAVRCRQGLRAGTPAHKRWGSLHRHRSIPLGRTPSIGGVVGPSGILGVMPDGNLLVSDSVMSVIWKISEDDIARDGKIARRAFELAGSRRRS